MLGCVITGLVQVVIIQWSIKGAGAFDILFVNSFRSCLSSAASVIYFVLLAVLLVIGLRFDDAKIQKFGLVPGVASSHHPAVLFPLY